MNYYEILWDDEKLKHKSNYFFLKMLENEEITEDEYFDLIAPWEIDIECIKDGTSSKNQRRLKRINRIYNNQKKKNKKKKEYKGWNWSNKWWQYPNHFHKNDRYSFYKKYANRYFRRCYKGIALSRRNYRKTFDYWWTVD